MESIFLQSGNIRPPLDKRRKIKPDIIRFDWVC